MRISISRHARLALLLPILLAGCQKPVEVPKASTSAPATNTSATSTPSVSVAQPGLVPPSDASIKPAPPDLTSNSQQANDKSDMSKQQESSAMPMPGQVNNHSPSTIYNKK